MITVTDKALGRTKRQAGKEGREPVLRVGVRGGGCSGFSYFMELIDRGGVTDQDSVLERDGVTIVCDPKSLKLIDGMTLDFDTNLLTGGYRFHNPNAKKSCSCGTSFSV